MELETHEFYCKADCDSLWALDGVAYCRYCKAWLYESSEYKFIANEDCPLIDTEEL